jgi:hypothetical protein
MQQEIMRNYKKKYPQSDVLQAEAKPIRFMAPDGYDDRFDHFVNFFESIRNGKPVVEDAAFGFRAAAPCLACNESYFQKKVINWDPVRMKLI